MRQRYRLIGTVLELDGHEDHLAIAQIFQIVNFEFALAVALVPCLAGLVGVFDRRAILHMHAPRADLFGNRNGSTVRRRMS